MGGGADHAVKLLNRSIVIFEAALYILTHLIGHIIRRIAFFLFHEKRAVWFVLFYAWCPEPHSDSQLTQAEYIFSWPRYHTSSAAPSHYYSYAFLLFPDTGPWRRDMPR